MKSKGKNKTQFTKYKVLQVKFKKAKRYSTTKLKRKIKNIMNRKH